MASIEAKLERLIAFFFQDRAGLLAQIKDLTDQLAAEHADDLTLQTQVTVAEGNLIAAQERAAALQELVEEDQEQDERLGAAIDAALDALGLTEAADDDEVA